MTTLREGFTTGSAVAAAAHAAVLLFCGKTLPQKINIPLPPVPLTAGRPSAEGLLRLNIPVAAWPSPLPGFTGACVIKDGGDDPDATHGMRLIVAAGAVPPSSSADSSGLVNSLNSSGSVSPLNPSGLADPLSPMHLADPTPLVLPAAGRDIFFYAGRGIGRATLPGLPVAVGEPAVNPEPRKQIALAVEEAATACGYTGPLHILLFAPDGEERATHTLNPRLGILGGISILGTQGTVRPYSHDAWQAAIEQGLSVARAVGLTEILFSTGRRSERLLFNLYPHLPPTAGVQAADFAAFSLRSAGSMGFTRLIWGCFPGKLLKLAQGLAYTHAKTAPADLELIFGPLRLRDPALAGQLADMPTAAGIFTHLEEHRPDLLRELAHTLGIEALRHLRLWAGPLPHLRLVVFTPGQQALPPLDDPAGG